MRVFGIEKDGKFKEFSQTPFQADHEEAILENWLEANPDGILEDGNLLIIGRQVSTNLGSIIDLLGVDRQGDVVVLELKRDKTPRDTLAQTLEYASFVENLDTEQLEMILQKYINDESVNLADYHRKSFELSPEEAVAFNKDQRLLIVGQRISEEIRQTSTFLRKKGVRVTCLEFTFFETMDGTKLLSHELVIGREPAKVKQVFSGSLPTISKETFLHSLDDQGRPVFEKILNYAEKNSLPIHWGSKGFSLNVDVNGVHIALCFGYPPHSVFKQSISTAIYTRGGLQNKLDIMQEELESLYNDAKTAGISQPAGKELKALIIRKWTEQEIYKLIEWLEKAVQVVYQNDLK